MQDAIRLTLLSNSSVEFRGRLQLDPGSGEPKTSFIAGEGGNDYVCGKCSAVLMSKVPKPMFGNGALRCNSCGRYNDGVRPAKYSSPTMNEDVEHLTKPEETYPRIEKDLPRMGSSGKRGEACFDTKYLIQCGRYRYYKR